MSRDSVFVFVVAMYIVQIAEWFFLIVDPKACLIHLVKVHVLIASVGGIWVLLVWPFVPKVLCDLLFRGGVCLMPVYSVILLSRVGRVTMDRCCRGHNGSDKTD